MKVHEAEVIEDPIMVHEPEPEEVDWGPRPSKTAREYRADATRIRGEHRATVGVRLTQAEKVFLERLAAWMAARGTLARFVRGSSGNTDFPGYGNAIGYLISAYGAMLDREMKEAGYDPTTGNLLQLPETTK